MKQNEETKVRQRKEYAAKGERSQKMISFRCDNDNIAWLDQKPNKGRYINLLIRVDHMTGTLKKKGLISNSDQRVIENRNNK